MVRLARYLPKILLATVAAASVVLASLPVLRHAAGIVVVDIEPQPVLPGFQAEEKTDLTPLFQRAPFGRRADTAVASSNNSRPAQNFTLRGVFVATGTLSSALLEIDGTPGRFRIKENVTPAYVLSHVAFDHVVLTGRDQSLTLRFDEDALPSEAPKPERATTSEDLIARLGGGIVVPARYEKPKAPETTSEYIDYWRKRIQKNPQAVLDQIGLTPSDDGYVIADKHDVGVRLAGLKAGDLVRRVNGQMVGNPEDDRRFYDRIAASGQARLEVERNGRVLTFSFPLR